MEEEMAQQTTGQLRTAAYEAEQAKDYRRAAKLYQAALDAYPTAHPKNAAHAACAPWWSTQNACARWQHELQH
jgi:hypothetical protein